MIPERGHEEQAKCLQTALANVKREAAFMKQEIKAESTEKALMFAGLILRELRTGNLTPTNYYELWMAVTDELRHLQMYFKDLSMSAGTMVDLYQRVQYASSIVPRLYLLCTVGSVFIDSKQAPARIVLNDLVEMSRGVQHPIRGLFLRNYLSQVTKDILPDIGSETGEVSDSIDFTLRNFGEMNRLWVRMQKKGKKNEQPIREKDRKELKLLVGTNLVRLSQLDGVTCDVYKTQVLPKILEQIINCKDRIAQEYLMDCIIQVFPDDFHLATLKDLLEACTLLKPEVDMGQIITTLLGRIANYANSQDEVSIPVDAFNELETSIDSIVSAFAETMQVSNVLRTYAALVDFAMSCFPTNTSLVDRVFKTVAAYLSSPAAAGGAVTNGNPAESIRIAEKLLTKPLQTLTIRVITLQYYSSVMSFLPWQSKRTVASEILQAVLSVDITLGDEPTLERLLHFISPLLMDDQAVADQHQGGAMDEEDDDFQETQYLVCRLLHRIHSASLDTQHAMLGVAYQFWTRAGSSRIKYTTLPLAYRYLQLAQSITNLANAQQVTETISKDSTDQEPTDKAKPETGEDVTVTDESENNAQDQPAPETNAEATVTEDTGEATELQADSVDSGDVEESASSEDKGTVLSPDTRSSATEEIVSAGNQVVQHNVELRQVFQTVHEMLMKFVQVPGCATTSLRVFLQAALAASDAKVEAICYEFVVQAFTVYEEALDSKMQVDALKLMISTVQQCKIFEKENWETLVSKLLQYSGRMLKKPDQCRMTYTCAHLFWPPRFGEDGKRALECLQKSLKIADACMGSSNALLFVELLNRYVYFVDQGLERIHLKYISGLVELINDQLTQDRGQSSEIRSSFASTLDYIREKVKLAESEQTVETDLVKRYAGLKV